MSAKIGSNAVTPSSAITLLTQCLTARMPIMFWGAPGVGKSAIIREVATALDWSLIDIRAISLEPVDVRGIPTVENGMTIWSTPSFLPVEARDGKNGILFLDELTGATESMQVALLQLVHERTLGDNYRLPNGWVVVAAGNRAGDGTFSKKMSKALGSRFATHIDLVVDFKEWMTWARDNSVAPQVRMYLEHRPHHLMAFEAKSQENSFPCPRTWDMASRFVDVITDRAAALAFFAGCLGEAVGTEFVGFLRIWRDLPALRDIFEDPKNTMLPQEPAAMYAICGALANAAEPSNIHHAFAYMERFGKEFQMVFAREVIAHPKHAAAFQQSQAFIQWAIANESMV